MSEPDDAMRQVTVPVDTQLAVLRVKMDQLIELNKTRGEDHEARIRKLEERKFPLPTISVITAIIALGLALLTYLNK